MHVNCAVYSSLVYMCGYDSLPLKCVYTVHSVVSDYVNIIP